MQEPHQIQERINAHRAVVALIEEQLQEFESMLEHLYTKPKANGLNTIHPQRVGMIMVTMETLHANKYWNEDMIFELDKQYNEALDKETRGW